MAIEGLAAFGEEKNQVSVIKGTTKLIHVWLFYSAVVSMVQSDRVAV
jgi:hypothetical protein